MEITQTVERRTSVECDPWDCVVLVWPEAYVGAPSGLWALVVLVIVLEVGQGWRFLFGLEGELEALGCAANGEGAAGNSLHIVAAHLEVGHGVHSPELYSRNVICLGCFLLRGCITKNALEIRLPDIEHNKV